MNPLALTLTFVLIEAGGFPANSDSVNRHRARSKTCSRLAFRTVERGLRVSVFRLWKWRFYANNYLRPPRLTARAILGLMIPLPKPRGFWDYALFALPMTGMLMLLFWLEASDAISWTDAALASAVAVLFVFTTILARRGERAKWITQPTLHAHALVLLGTLVLIFGAMYADAYLFHRRDITPNRLRHDIEFSILFTVGMLWSSRRRLRAKRP